jgi:hypothetical protein
MADGDSTAGAAEAELKAESLATGAGFRAVITRGGQVLWSCNHVHFTDHSAKADAQAHLARMQADDARPAEAATVP